MVNIPRKTAKMMLSWFPALLIWISCSFNLVAARVTFGRRDTLPTLTLPYATYRASKYDSKSDIYTFKNIRFAAAPVGNLRWARPAPPPKQDGIQDGSFGPICKQAPIAGLQLVSNLAGAISKESDEDCLFLDIYVPGKAIRDPSKKLPVISWFFGGAYVLGAKDQYGDLVPFYQGTGLLQQSGGNVIFVASNYRLGAYGWLAGSSMEKDGLPNAGLYDQRAVLQWIQDYIGLVGGDKSQVSAWGESAGGGSILHHLIAFGGKQDPLFTKAVLQSPAFELKFDRKGLVEDVFKNYTALAGCAGQGVACLRAASADALDQANQQLNQNVPGNVLPVGPTPDGSWVRQLAALELTSGNFHQVDSIILSHVSNEAEVFIPPGVNTDSQFSKYLTYVFPPYTQAAGVTSSIESRYPPVNSPGSPYLTERDRLRGYVGDHSFYCYIRFLTDAYSGKIYNLRYSVTPGLHATDLLPTFYNLNLDLKAFGQTINLPLIPIFGPFAQAYQSYLTSHARSGDPNTYKKTLNIPPAITWPKPDNTGNALKGVLNAGDLGFSVVTDSQINKDTCQFWRDVARKVTDAGGYAPAS